jgi:raffinose/stachyose/melibiose transport system permease protein
MKTSHKICCTHPDRGSARLDRADLYADHDRHQKQKRLFQQSRPFQLPAAARVVQLRNAIAKGRLLTYMKNDLIISCLKVPLGILVESMAAFALTRLKVKHSTGIFIFFLIGMMLPMQTALVPINVTYSKLNLLNTYFGLFYVYIGFGISYGILIMRGFFRSIPRDIDEAALIDGCTKWRLVLEHHTCPFSKPDIATLIITDFSPPGTNTCSPASSSTKTA